MERSKGTEEIGLIGGLLEEDPLKQSQIGRWTVRTCRGRAHGRSRDGEIEQIQRREKGRFISSNSKRKPKMGPVGNLKKNNDK